MPAPDNLTREAIDDYDQILYDSLAWGADHAEDMELKLDAICDRIGQGQGYGHTRADVRTTEPILFVAAPKPFVIAYNAETNMVLRIIHGARAFPRLFPLP